MRTSKFAHRITIIGIPLLLLFGLGGLGGLGGAWGQTLQYPALSTPNIFTNSNQFGSGVYLGPQLFANLSSLVGLTNLVYISDGTPGSSPCTGLGTGALAIYLNGQWNCSGGGGGGGGGGSGTINSSSQFAIPYYSASPSGIVLSGIAAPTSLNGVPFQFISVPSGGLATLSLWSPGGVTPRTTNCPGNTDTILITDRLGYISWSDASSCIVTLAQAGTAGFANNFAFVGCSIGAGSAVITPTSPSTISYSTGSSYTSGATSMPLTTGQCAFVYMDNANYFALKIGGGSGIVTGATTNGGLTLTSTTLGLLTSCSDQQVLLWTASGSSWGCATPPGTGSVTGSGTLNHIAMWTGSGTIGNNTNNFTITGRCGSYNSNNCVSNGFAQTVGVQQGSGFTGNMSATTIVSSTGTNLNYRISCYNVISIAATSSSTLPQCQVSWTDLITSVVETATFNSTSAGNTVGNFVQGSIFINPKNSTAITVSTTGYASSGGTSMQYVVDFEAETL
jgi:hypothetical protein